MQLFNDMGQNLGSSSPLLLLPRIPTLRNSSWLTSKYLESSPFSHSSVSHQNLMSPYYNSLLSLWFHLGSPRSWFLESSQWSLKSSSKIAGSFAQIPPVFSLPVQMETPVLPVVDEAFGYLPPAFFYLWSPLCPWLASLSPSLRATLPLSLNSLPWTCLALLPWLLVIPSSWVLFPQKCKRLSLLTSFESLLRNHLLNESFPPISSSPLLIPFTLPCLSLLS